LSDCSYCPPAEAREERPDKRQLLQKKSHFCSWHYVREGVASGRGKLTFKGSTENKSDALFNKGISELCDEE